MKQTVFFIALLIGFTVHAPVAALEVGVGPFGLQIDAGIHIGKHDEYVEVLEEPICQAIRQRNLLELIVEPSNSQELRRIVLEPYLMGYSMNGELILKGYKLEHVLFSEEVEGRDALHARGGLILEYDQVTAKWRTIRLNRVVRMDILGDTHFKEREVKKEFNDEAVKVICSIWK